MHVFTEARRVLQFRDLCTSADASGASALLQELGKLMDESQQSCSTLFECSCPELDKLTALAKAHGAYGSRLTGEPFQFQKKECWLTSWFKVLGGAVAQSP